MQMMQLDSGADPLLAGLAGSAARLSGTDPAPYARRVMDIWRGVESPVPIPDDKALASSVQNAGLMDSLAERLGLSSLVNRFGLILLGLVVAGVGLYLIAKD